MTRPRWWWLWGLMVVVGASSAWAQTPVINPSRVEFDSVDHAVACPGDNCITGYRVEVWLPTVDPATGSPISTSTLEKTKVTTTGGTPAYRALLSDCVPMVAPPPGVQVVVRMVAVGTYLSSARSNASNPFVRATAPATVSGVAVAP